MSDRATLPGSGGTGDSAGTAWTTTAIDKLPGGRAALNFEAGPIDVTTLATVVTETFTAMTSRRYEVDAELVITGSVIGDVARIMITDGSNVEIKDSEMRIDSLSGQPLKYAADDMPSAGSMTYKIRGERASGTGTINITGATLRITDVGPAF